ncbi:MAG: ABC transporter substrate-binding protein, partial [Deltaproteobacteria bacterium]|nr:ABC transporter substrate-binding protein [Deltaproteobacteria bacterium]
GLDVELLGFEGGTQALRGGIARGLDLAWSSGDPIIIARARGGPIRALYSSAAKLSVSMVVSGEIKEPKDLRGKKIGIQEVGAFVEVHSRNVMALGGLTPRDVQYVTVSTAGRVQALLIGHVDTGILHVEQGIRALKRKPSLRVLANIWEVVPDWWYSGVMVHEKTLAEDRRAIVGAIRSMMRANRFIYQNRDETVRIVVKHGGYSPDEIGPTYDILTKGGIFSVHDGMPRKMIEYTIEKLVENGRIPRDKRPTYEQVVDASVAREALEKVGRWTGEPRLDY